MTSTGGSGFGAGSAGGIFVRQIYDPDCSQRDPEDLEFDPNAPNPFCPNPYYDAPPALTRGGGGGGYEGGTYSGGFVLNPVGGGGSSYAAPRFADRVLAVPGAWGAAPWDDPQYFPEDGSVALACIETATPVGPTAPLAVVTKTADTSDGACDADCSLREALRVSAEVRFSPALDGQTLALTRGPLVPAFSVTVDASALPSGLTIDAGGASRHFDVRGDTLTLRGLTLSNGQAATDGGSVHVQSGAGLVAERVAFVGNSAAGDGGAVYVEGGSLTAEDATFSGNATSGRGGALSVGLGGSAAVTDARFTGNTASIDGGGVYVEGGTFTAERSAFDANRAVFGGGLYTNGGTIELRTSSVTGNSATGSAGGVYGVRGFEAAEGRPATVRLYGTTVADNAAGSGASGVRVWGSGSTLSAVGTVIASASATADCEAANSATASLSYAHVEDGSCGAASTGDPGLVALAGPQGAPLLRPSEGSPLLDAGTCDFDRDGTADVSFDARGQARPVRVGPVVDDGCDIGAVEATVDEVGAATASVTLDGAAGWRMLSSPQDTTLAAFLGGLWTQGFPGSDNPGGACTVFVYDEAAASFADGWTCLPDGTQTTPAGTGFMAYVYDDDDPGQPGVQNPFPKTLTTAAPVVPPLSFDFGVRFADDARPFGQKGWNLLGNPVGAALAWAAVDRTAVRPTVYVYDPDFFGGDYRTATVEGGVTYGDLAGGLIPPFQGFFVHALGADPTLRAARGAFGQPRDVLGRQATPAVVRLSVSEGADERSAAYVALADGAALGPDAADALRLAPTAWPRAALFTTALGADDPLVANALPADLGGQAAVEVPLGVDVAGFDGPVALALAASVEGLPDGWTLTLLDRQTGAEAALGAGARYTFTAEGAADGAAARRGDAARPEALAPSDTRFALRISTGAAVAAGGGAARAETALDWIAPNPTAGRATVAWSLAEPGPARLTVVDLLGRELAVLADGPHAAGPHRAELPSGRLTPGVYVVRLVAGPTAAAARLTILR